MDSHFRVGIFEPKIKPIFKDIPNNLDYFQSIVGGYIEVLRIEEGDGLMLVCNEEGKIHHLQKNRIIWSIGGLDMIHGTFFVCRTEGSEFSSISLEDETRLAKWAGPMDVWNVQAGLTVDWDTP